MSRNPFDSDDESGSPVKSSSKDAINPFDDDNFQPQGRAVRPQKVNHHNSGNPFEDDNDDKDALLKPSLKPQSRPSQQKGFFDDEDDVSVSNLSKQVEGKERSGHHFKDRISASGDAALRRAQKIKDVGATQASKIIDGSITQAQKMKESTYSTFKYNNVQTSAKKGSIDLKSEPDNGLRNELFEGTSAVKTTRVRYDDSQFQKQDLEYKSMEDLEGYALQKAEDTTSTVQNCLRVAEEMKCDATRTLLNLHEQGEQITKTHELTFDIDHNLSRGEKLLGSLGGMFSKTWKPKKSRPITGPAISKSDSFKRRGHHLEQQVALGLTKTNSRGRGNRITPSANIKQTTYDKLEVEKAKQDDALSAISNVLDDLKIMSQDMGSEISSQTVALDTFDTDVGTLKVRVQDANYRARGLLRR
ncbi:hypothetical protein GOP47_0010289 [Adiantum capillus-veneris]|uniref:t-SNARE coiled-coil homology domain-containing protein n=1 Tax=Adiantum capillus-veneris TaxID=13818 RepID=A0A9D4UVL0_ADICA|nr:hypothetical protein GOP47_0010289 [Adiantum capillus-veneris]